MERINRLLIRNLVLIVVLLSTFNGTSQIHKVWKNDSIVEVISYTTGDYHGFPNYTIKGYPQGIWKLYEDTSLTTLIFEVEYDSSGVIYSKSYYLSGILMSLSTQNQQIYWYANGIVERTISYVGDTIFINRFYESGMIKETIVICDTNSSKLRYLKLIKWNEEGVLEERNGKKYQ